MDVIPASKNKKHKGWHETSVGDEVTTKEARENISKMNDRLHELDQTPSSMSFGDDSGDTHDDTISADSKQNYDGKKWSKRRFMLNQLKLSKMAKKKKTYRDGDGNNGSSGHTIQNNEARCQQRFLNHIDTIASNISQIQQGTKKILAIEEQMIQSISSTREEELSRRVRGISNKINVLALDTKKQIESLQNETSNQLLKIQTKKLAEEEAHYLRYVLL